MLAHEPTSGIAVRSACDPLRTLPGIAIIRSTMNNWLADIRTWAVCLTAFCAACTSAVACTVPGAAPQTSIFFEQVPTEIETTPVIIEATVYSATLGSYADAGTFPTGTLMKARVDRVIKGSIDAKYLTVFVSINSCYGVGVGRGIILGSLRDDPQRGIMLLAIQNAKVDGWSKEFRARQEAQKRAAKCEKNEFGARECRVPGIGPEWDRP
jgi:hypothetical protein